MTEDDCSSNWPSVFSLGTTCECADCSTPPTNFGACCYEDAAGLVCEETDSKTCNILNGEWTQGVSCECITCEVITGACCVYYEAAGNWYCEELTESQCIEGAANWWYGEGTTCNDGNIECELPPTTGVCCYQFGCESYCTEMDEDTCSTFFGSTYFPNDTCETVSCPPPPQYIGACCYEDSAGGVVCENTDAKTCSLLLGTWVQGIPCKCVGCETPPVIGACCYLDVDSGYMICEVISESECNEKPAGTYSGDDTTCADTICCEPIGACCIAGRCLLVDSNQCSAAAGDYSGNGVVCEIVTCDYCPADLDGDGDIDVADLLILIAAWGVCP